MKTSICSAAGTARWGTEQGFAELKNAGFEAVDYGGACGTYKHFSGLYTLPDAEFYHHFEQERRVIEAAGLEIGQIHCPYNSPPDRVTEQELEFFIAAVKRAIRAAAVLGAPLAVVHPVIPVGWDRDSSISYALTDRLCEEYAEIGQRVGVRVALENMPGDDTTVPYSCAEHFLRLFEKLDTPWLVACLDSGHANWALPAGTLPEMIRALGGHIHCVHLHDNGGTWDNHFFPYGGTLDWDAVCIALGQSGYTGNVNLETHMLKQAGNEVYRQSLRLQCAIAAELRDKIEAAR